jgi:EmrB/QacA subfamily drug resistance transporter
VTAGDLADRFGSRRVFVAGLLAFAGSSAACGFSPSMLVLDTARAAQGATAAVVAASGLALLVGLHPPADRGRALGISGAIAALSFVVGPLVGGVLTDTLGWRSVFLANVPVAALIALAARTILPDTSRRQPPNRFDYVGVATFTVGLGALLYAALGGAARSANGESVAAAAVGVAGLLAFVAHERRTSDGVVDLRLFRDRTFAGAVAATALAGGAYFGMLVYLSLFLQGTQHYGAVEAGLLYLPAILPFMIISPFAGRLLTHRPGARVPTTGLILIAAGMLLLLGVEDGAGVLDVTAGMVIAGIGTGLAVTPLTQVALAQVPSERSGMASGLLQTARPVGVTVGVTVLGLVVPHHVDAAAFHAVAAVAAGITVIGALTAALTIRKDTSGRAEPLGLHVGGPATWVPDEYDT